jgi:hypothetical protein
MRGMLAVAVGVLFANMVGPACAGDAYSPYVVLSGSDSGVSTAACVRIVSEDAWCNLWDQHTRTIGKTPLGFTVQKPPVVDFRTCMVIAVFGGSTWNTEGLRFITSSSGETEVVVGLDWLTYQSMETGDKVTSYGFLIVPRTEKAIRIQFDARGLSERSENAPPKWKDHHTFPKMTLSR